MTDRLSRMTQRFRRVAQYLPKTGRLRRGLSALWDVGLSAVGCRHLSVPFAGQSVRLRVRYRRLNSEYEANAVRTLLALIKSGDTVWDVGANIGLYALLMARKVGPAGRVIAWEPSPQTFRVLSDHIEANDLGACCELRNAAVADTVGTLPFAESADEAEPTNRLGHSDRTPTVQVPVETLDACLRISSRAPSVVKIDIEGAEVLALRGAGELLAPGGARPSFMVAVHPQFLPEFGCAPAELSEIARRNAYVWTDLSGCPAEPHEYNEFLMIPGECVDVMGTRIRTS